jgi:hypothetical protein
LSASPSTKRFFGCSRAFLSSSNGVCWAAVETCSEQTNCSAKNCRQACAREVIDSLLREHGTVRGEEVDLLLDLRWLLGHREQPGNALRLFCELRRRLEEKHYLLFYRLRRWLENHLEVVVPTSADPVKLPLRLDYYCFEAILAQSARLARQTGQMKPDSKVGFGFRAEEPAVVTGGS